MKIIRPLDVVDAVLTSSNVTENDGSAGAWSVITAYTVGQTVRYVIANVHQVYECLVNNTGVTPGTDDTKWLLVGATNRWKMFDESVQSQTTNSNSIAVTLTPASTDRVDSVVLLNLSAASVQITVTDPVDGLVYDETVSLVSDSGITDWWAYFFEPIIRVTDLAQTDLPPYSGAAIAITITDTGATAACGECVLGLSREIGGLQNRARVGIQDYSVKQQDDFGNYTILERAFANRASFVVWVESGFVDALKNLLSGYRATPVVYVGSDSYASTIIYGFYKDFNLEIAYDKVSICSLELEGLT